MDSIAEAGKILNLGGLHQQASVFHALEDDGIEFRACGVDGRCITGRWEPTMMTS